MVTTRDFAAALEAASGKPLGPALLAYLDQPGVPRLATELACAPTGNHVVMSHEAEPWPVPVCVAYDHDGARGEACVVVTGPAMKLALPGATCPRWVFPNASATGLYRHDWLKTLPALVGPAWPHLTEPEKLLLLAEARRTEPALLSVAIPLLASTDPTAFGLAASTLASFEDAVPGDLVAAFRARVRAQVSPRIARTPLAARDHVELGPTLLAGLARDPGVVREAVALADRAGLAGPLTSVVLRVATLAEPRRLEQLLAAATRRDRTHAHVVDAWLACRGARSAERDLPLLAQFTPDERVPAARDPLPPHTDRTCARRRGACVHGRRPRPPAVRARLPEVPRSPHQARARVPRVAQAARLMP